MNKKPEIVRVYLPPDANTLLSTYDHCLRSRHYVNVVVAGKQPQADWLAVDEAAAHCARGVGIWEWAGTERRAGERPDVVLACAGDVPTLETLAAAAILRTRLPDLRVRVVNVVDLMRLLPETEHPHGLPDREFDTLFTDGPAGDLRLPRLPVADPPAHLPPPQPRRLHVRGYKENGTTTTPFDMVMLNDLDRYHLVMDVIDRVPGLGEHAAGLRQEMVDARAPGPRLDPRARRGHPRGRATGAGTAEPVRVLTVNAGSTSMKLVVVDGGGDGQRFDSLDDALAGSAALTRSRTGSCTVATATAPALVDDALVAELAAI